MSSNYSLVIYAVAMSANSALYYMSRCCGVISQFDALLHIKLLWLYYTTLLWRGTSLQGKGLRCTASAAQYRLHSIGRRPARELTLSTSDHKSSMR